MRHKRIVLPGHLGAVAAAGVAAAVAMACARPPQPLPEASPRTGEAWVEGTLARMTLRQKVGQLIMPWIGGDYLADGTPEYEQLRHWVVDDGVGGVVVSIGPPLEVASKLNMLQRLAAVPLLVASDLEHGPGMRLNGAVVYPYGLEIGGGTEFPSAMGVGATGDPRLAYAMGRITAIEGRAVGIQLDFAPVSDVNNNPANPIINVRSYGADPQAVARMVAAQVRGLQDNGMWATAKHFPGHGDAGTDSHLELPIITVDSARVDTVELVPFRAAIHAGVKAVMSAHIAFPALTGDTTPATLSPRLLDGLLRHELGFDGLVITDAMGMGGIVRRYGNERAPILALRAGADILLMPPNADSAIAAVVGAVHDGELTEARIDRSVRRLLEAKAAFRLERRRTVDLAAIPEEVGVPAHMAVADSIARRAITVARDSQRLVPVTGDVEALSIVYTDDADPLAGRAFQATLRQRLPRLSTAFLDDQSGQEQLDSLRAAAGRADIVFIAAFVRVLAGKGQIAVAPRIASFIDDVARARPTIVTSFGNPYILAQFPDVGTYVLAWGPEEVVQRAAARALTGQAPITGRLPIPIPPLLPLGAGLTVTTPAATSPEGGHR
jgi:beta-N-acetylhexosaminidase